MLYLTCVLIFIAGVMAHGGIVSYNIDGKEYIGNPYHLGEMIGNGNPYSPLINTPDITIPSIQRPYYWYPIEDYTSPNMTCNYNGISNAPSFHAPVPAGGTVHAFWKSEGHPNSTFPYYMDWRHAHGPILAYLARCPSDSCANFEAKGNVWFKIAQVGLEPTATNMQAGDSWTQTYLNGWRDREEGWRVQIPKGLKNGAYLIRHEILMLAGNPAQSYPNCAQIMVTDGGDKQPKGEELVAFPGEYKVTGKSRTMVWK
ncbi:putative cellulose-growth-specific protein [Amylocarpus encephaloides]|uniref:AA9 family lytic polysaccharide monooxygenase n=1 Tax=Amylocarpus encephaloides TaxID=45428 RepID=A0A9P7Y7S4_9HELO|nr:putative cellulose-growth-specific protein [Amylocarpus encephaloides]